MRTSRTYQDQEHKRGAALMTLMIIVLLVAGTVAYLVNDAKQQAFAVTRVRDYLKAQAYAEGGANQAYSLLKTNFALRANSSAFPSTPYGDGTYDATVTAGTGVSTNKASVSCIGVRGHSTVNVMVDLQNFGSTNGSGGGGGTVPPAVGAYTYAIVTGGAQTWSGSGTLNCGAGGKIHANGQFKMTGSKQVTANISSCVKIWLTGSTKIYGNATAPIITAAADAITGTRTIETPPTVTIPDFDAATALAFKTAAQLAGAGAYYSGSATFNGSGDVTPPGGIVYAEGDITITGSGKLTGCFIANGALSFAGSGDQIQVGNYPAFVALTKKNDQNGSGKVHGLIYAGKSGTLSFGRTGSGDVIGTIISKGNFDASGSWSALTYENSTPVPPASGGGAGSPTSGDRVGVIAWQK